MRRWTSFSRGRERGLLGTPFLHGVNLPELCCWSETRWMCSSSGAPIVDQSLLEFGEELDPQCPWDEVGVGYLGERNDEHLRVR